MKKITISFNYDEEKLSAVKMFISQKDTDLDAELEGFMDSLYKKHVPLGVREYIEMIDEQTGREKEKKKAARPPLPAAQPPAASQPPAAAQPDMLRNKGGQD